MKFILSLVLLAVVAVNAGNPPPLVWSQPKAAVLPAYKPILNPKPLLPQPKAAVLPTYKPAPQIWKPKPTLAAYNPLPTVRLIKPTYAPLKVIPTAPRKNIIIKPSPSKIPLNSQSGQNRWALAAGGGGWSG